MCVYKLPDGFTLDNPKSIVVHNEIVDVDELEYIFQVLTDIDRVALINTKLIDGYMDSAPKFNRIDIIDANLSLNSNKLLADSVSIYNSTIRDGEICALYELKTHIVNFYNVKVCAGNLKTESTMLDNCDFDSAHIN